MNKRLLLSIVVLAGAALIAQAADVSGTWTAQVPGRGGETREQTFNFKVEGDKLTGTVAGPRGELAIEDGKVSGDEISFKQTVEFNNNKFTFKYKGKVSGNEIKFTREREGGEGRTQEFVAKRKQT